jgi:hypothetical protein
MYFPFADEAHLQEAKNAALFVCGDVFFELTVFHRVHEGVEAIRTTLPRSGRSAAITKAASDAA